MQALHALEREAVNAARQVERYYEQGRLVGLEDPLPAADLVNEVTTGQWRNVEGETAASGSTRHPGCRLHGLAF